VCCPHHNTNAKAANRTQYLPSKNSSLTSSSPSSPPIFFLCSVQRRIIYDTSYRSHFIIFTQLRNAEPRSPSSPTRRLDSALLLFLVVVVLNSIYFPYRRRRTLKSSLVPILWLRDRCGCAVVCSAIISCRGAICLLCLVPRAFDLLHIVSDRFDIEFSILSPIPSICLVFFIFFIIQLSAFGSQSIKDEAVRRDWNGSVGINSPTPFTVRARPIPYKDS